MTADRVKLSRVKGRNQIVIAFHKDLLKGSDFKEDEYVMMIFDKDKIMIVKEDQINRLIKEDKTKEK